MLDFLRAASFHVKIGAVQFQGRKKKKKKFTGTSKLESEEVEEKKEEYAQVNSMR